jgi:hypothetical protein
VEGGGKVIGNSSALRIPPRGFNDLDKVKEKATLFKLYGQFPSTAYPCIV